MDFIRRLYTFVYPPAAGTRWEAVNAASGHGTLHFKMFVCMNSQHQQPVFDLNNLDDQHELRFDYDRKGNLKRVRKVRRNDGRAAFLVFLVLIILGGWLWWMVSS